MAGEIQISYATGQTLWVMLWDATGQVWNGASFGAYATGSIASYAITLTEQGTASQEYLGTMPAVSAGIYRLTARSGSVAESAKRVGSGVVSWSGSVLVPVTTSTALATAYLDLPSAVAGKTLREHERYVSAVLAGKVEGAGTGTEVFKDYAEVVRVTSTVDVDGNRTAVTYG